MAEFLTALGAQAQALRPAEVIAVLTAIAYLVLAIRQNIWCWLFAAISTSIYIALFFVEKLYMESALNVFYLAMAVYGWFAWRAGGTDDLPVSSWPLTRHAVAVIVVVAFTAASGYLLETFTDAAFPFADSLTTWAALWTTFLVARKVIENWWYWLVIDGVLVVMFWHRDLELTALLYFAYLLMIPFGLISWRRSMREQGAA